MLRLPSVRYAGDGGREVRRVAVLPGSGAEAIARGVARSPTCSSPATSSTTRRARRRPRAWPWSTRRTASPSRRACCAGPSGSRDALGPDVAVETYRDPAVVVWRDVAGTSGRARWGARAQGLGADCAPLRRRRAKPAPAAARTPAPRASATANRDDDRYHLYTDGGARGNPGPAGIGAHLITADGDVVEELADYIGTATNNVAEYQALIAGLEIALDRGVERLDVFLDSEIVVRQVNGQYKVKDAGLKPLHRQACLLLSRFHEVDVSTSAASRTRPRTHS